MKTYRGKRIYGDCPGVEVTVDGKPLKHIVHHSPNGFEWGYSGSGPADLALSILADYLGDYNKAWLWHQHFKFCFVAGFSEPGWELTGSEINKYLQEVQASV